MKYKFFGISYLIIFSVSEGEKSLVDKKHILQCKLAGLLLNGLVERYEFHSWPRGNDFSLMVYCAKDKSAAAKKRLREIFKENNIKPERKKI